MPETTDNLSVPGNGSSTARVPERTNNQAFPREVPRLTVSPLLVTNRAIDGSEALRRELEADSQQQRSRGLVSSFFVSFLPRRDFTASLGGSGQGMDQVELMRRIKENQSARLVEDDVAHLATGFFKTASLFLPKRYGYVAAALMFGAEEIKPGSTPGQMVVDGLLGAGKGLSAKGFLEYAHGRQWSPEKTGVLLGGFTRLSDTTLTRTNWTNQDGDADLLGGAGRVLTNTLNPAAVGMDYFVFKAGGAGFNYLNRSIPGLEKNLVARYLATGGTLGVSAGFSGEAMRQWQEGELNIPRLLWRPLAQGVVDAAATYPGARMTLHFQRREAENIAARERIERPATITSERTGELSRATVEEMIRAHEQLGQGQRTTDSFWKLKEGKLTESRNYEQWARANLVRDSRQVNAYEVDGTQILIPERFDAQFRALRTELARRAQTGESLVLPKEHPLHEVQNLVQPGELAALIRNSPNPDLIRIVRVLPERNPDDAFVAQFEGNSYRSEASASRQGEINLFQVRRSGILAQDFLHEWSHLARYGMPLYRHLFDQAAGLEAEGHYASPYARRGGIEENWSVHTAEEIANPNMARAEHFASRAPIRSAVIIRTLLESLGNVPADRRTPSQNQLEARLNALSRTTMPAAEKALLEIVQRANIPAEEMQSAARLLLHLGRPETAAQMSNVTELRLAGEPELTQTFLQNLGRLPNLRSLDLSATPLQDWQTSQLSGLTRVTNLDLRNTEIGSWGLMQLGLRPSSLSLEYTRTDAAAIPTLVGMRPSVLNLRGTMLTSGDIELLQRQLPQTQINH